MPRTEAAETLEQRQRVGSAAIRAFFNIAQLWELSTAEQLILLGQPTRQTLHNWKKGSARLNHDQLTRLSYIVGIYKALQLLFKNASTADAWLKTPNDDFAGEPPLSLALRGDITDLAALRRYLDAARG